jgi:putative MATE family efflux protein
VINIGTVTSNNLIRAEGFAKISMVTMATGAVLNMILDPIFIFTLGWGIEGAAFATILAQAVAFAFIQTAYRKCGAAVRFSFRYFTWDKGIYAEILKIGIPVLIYQGLSSLSMAIINQQAAYFGTEAVAAMGIVTKIIAFMSYVIFGFVKGLQPIAGYHYGAGNYRKVAEAIRASNGFLTGYAIVAAAGAIVWAPGLIGAFTSDPAVAALGREALVAWSLSFVLLGVQMTYVTAFLAMGKAKAGSIVGLSRQGLILIPLLVGLRAIYGLKGIVYAQPISDLLTFTLTMGFARVLKFELKKAPEPLALRQEA